MLIYVKYNSTDGVNIETALSSCYINLIIWRFCLSDESCWLLVRPHSTGYATGVSNNLVMKKWQAL